MQIKKFLNFDNSQKERFCFGLMFGLPKMKITFYEVIADNLRFFQEPVFFLSTGRTGTHWFAQVLQKDKRFVVYHEPQPQLIFQAKYIYELHTHKKYPSELTKEIASQIFLTARFHHLFYTYRAKKRYIETNNHLTFFAPAIYKLIPSTKFVHLIRHPGQFVRSGLQKNWYQPGEPLNTKQITHPDQQIWDRFTKVQKIAWQWYEINSFIEQFKSQIPKEQIFTLNFSNFSTQELKDLLQFIGAQIPDKKLKKLIRKPTNTQKFDIPKFQDWPTDQKRQVWDICGQLAEKYGYTL